MGLKVGELAHSSGLTVRTLRYYDQIGLLTPSRSTGGHRLYDEADVQRLYRICLLRRIGLHLDDIASALDDPGWDLEHALRRHLDLVDHRLAVSGQLRKRLAAMLAAFPPKTSDVLETMEEMVMLDTAVQRRISILVYEDIAAAHAHLVGVFGLGEGRLDFADGVCVHGEVQAGDGVIWLHRVSPEFGLASPKTLGASTATTAVMVEDVDAHHARAVERGADVVYPPVDQPYGFREYSARDPEGGLWSFMSPLD
ncbi:MerR family transcriptional regulator [Lentzea tibetensis]|uniref:MerR family transcriptional regulator n=1 Tax=Lentzea tibetensis TaxID=2591470 RepID=A0A563F0R6_9PSEU|nr:MerR family transcriptional regulator [Lentzea tibetensis]TWP53351.1 MerR family transcriptional regulator [Lentzea tibetensis]